MMDLSMLDFWYFHQGTLPPMPELVIPARSPARFLLFSSKVFCLPSHAVPCRHNEKGHPIPCHPMGCPCGRLGWDFLVVAWGGMGWDNLGVDWDGMPFRWTWMRFPCGGMGRHGMECPWGRLGWDSLVAAWGGMTWYAPGMDWDGMPLPAGLDGIPLWWHTYPMLPQCNAAPCHPNGMPPQCNAAPCHPNAMPPHAATMQCHPCLPMPSQFHAIPCLPNGMLPQWHVTPMQCHPMPPHAALISCHPIAATNPSAHPSILYHSLPLMLVLNPIHCPLAHPSALGTAHTSAHPSAMTTIYPMGPCGMAPSGTWNCPLGWPV